MNLNGKTPSEIITELEKQEPMDERAAIAYWKKNVEQMILILQNTKANMKINADSTEFKLQQANTHVNVRVELAKAFIEIDKCNINGNHSAEFENAFKAVMKPMDEFIAKHRLPDSSIKQQLAKQTTLIKKPTLIK